MFDLENAITQWRQQMLAGGIKAPVPLEELESHLREDIEQQLQSEANAPQAFVSAVERIGQVNKIKNEFHKVERKSMKRKLTILVGVFALFMGIFMILPALGKHKQRNQAALATGTDFFAARWTADEVMGLRMGTTLAIAGLGVGLYGLKKRRAQES